MDSAPSKRYPRSFMFALLFIMFCGVACFVVSFVLDFKMVAHAGTEWRMYGFGLIVTSLWFMTDSWPARLLADVIKHWRGKFPEVKPPTSITDADSK